MFDGMTDEEAKKEYRRLAKEYHPDVGGDPVQFALIAACFAAKFKGEPELNLAGEFARLLDVLFRQGFAPKEMDLIDRLQRLAQTEIARHTETLLETQQHLDAFDEMLRRLKGEGSLRAALLGQRNQVHAANREANKAIKTTNIILDALKGYEYEWTSKNENCYTSRWHTWP